MAQSAGNGPVADGKGHTVAWRTRHGGRFLKGAVALAGLTIAFPAGVVLATAGPAAAAGTPVVTSVTADNGPTTGGTVVAIVGSGFTGETAVDFGGVPATGVTVNTDTSITATSPALAANIVGNTVDVTVTTGGGHERHRRG